MLTSIHGAFPPIPADARLLSSLQRNSAKNSHFPLNAFWGALLNGHAANVFLSVYCNTLLNKKLSYYATPLYAIPAYLPGIFLLWHHIVNFDACWN